MGLGQAACPGGTALRCPFGLSHPPQHSQEAAPGWSCLLGFYQGGNTWQFIFLITVGPFLFPTRLFSNL